MQKEVKNMTPVNETNRDKDMRTENEKRTYTVKELQEILDISRPTVYALLKRKEFHSITIGG